MPAQQLQGVAYDEHYFYLLDSGGELHVWEDIPVDGEQPLFSMRMNTHNGSLYSDGEHLSISGGDAFRVVRVEELGPNASFSEIRISERPQSYGQLIVKYGYVFVADLAQHRVVAWKTLESAVNGDEPDAILGAESVEDIDPDKNKEGLFGLTVSNLMEIDYGLQSIISGRVLSYLAR